MAEKMTLDELLAYVHKRMTEEIPNLTIKKRELTSELSKIDERRKELQTELREVESRLRTVEVSMGVPVAPIRAPVAAEVAIMGSKKKLALEYIWSKNIGESIREVDVAKAGGMAGSTAGELLKALVGLEYLRQDVRPGPYILTRKPEVK